MRTSGQMSRQGMLAFLLAMGGGSCSDLDLGEAPFFCNKGVPRCPGGYVCMESGKIQYCVREGSSPPPARDSRPSVLDKGPPKKDGKPSTGDGKPPPVDTLPADGQGTVPVTIYITEFLADPDVVPDADGEWLELFNPGSQGIDINGFTLKDQGIDSHVIKHSGPLVVPPKGYLLLGRTTDKVKNNGVNVTYAYGSAYSLANSEDEIILAGPNGSAIDSVVYSLAAGFLISKGASLSVKHPAMPKNVASNWCIETVAWPGSKGDKGTPGVNPGCS